MRIKVIIPISGLSEIEVKATKDYLMQWISKDTVIDVECLRKGPTALANAMDSAISIPYIAEIAVAAEKEGFDGVYVSCFDDPGIREIREIINIPIIGAFEGSMNICTNILDSLSIISPDMECIPSTAYKVRNSIYSQMVKNIRGLNATIEDVISGDVENLIYDTVLKINTEDNVDGIMLGCTGMFNAYINLKKKLESEDIKLVVLEPNSIALLELERLVKLNLSHSHRTYPYSVYKLL